MSPISHVCASQRTRCSVCELLSASLPMGRYTSTRQNGMAPATRVVIAKTQLKITTRRRSRRCATVCWDFATKIAGTVQWLFCVLAESNRRDPHHKEAAITLHISSRHTRSTCQGIKPQSNILLAIGGAILSINTSRIWGSLLSNCIALCSSLLGGDFCALFCQSSSQVVC